MSKRRRHKRKLPIGGNTPFQSATDALEMFDSMGMGDGAALQAAADHLGMDVADFCEQLAAESKDEP